MTNQTNRPQSPQRARERGPVFRFLVRLSWAVAGGLATAGVVGCYDEEIRHYKVPREQVRPSVSPADRLAIRLLAAIVPHNERTWFFKLVGPAPILARHKDAFDQFIQSVRFTDNAKEPLTWTVPDGWERKPGSELRYATFQLGSKDHPLELTVVALGREAGSLLDNVNRWRRQLGLKAVGAAELAQLTSEKKVDGATLTLVDMVTAGSTSSTRPAPARDLTYTIPEGWKKHPNPDRLHRAAFFVSDGGKQAETTVTPFPGQAGGLLANVNRWRGQIQIGPVTQEQLRKDLNTIEIAGDPCPYVDLLGPAAEGQRILGIVAERGGQTWFIKMKGPADLVGKQKPAFEAFAKSLKFNGDRGGNNE
jgi:hypothetical protein